MGKFSAPFDREPPMARARGGGEGGGREARVKVDGGIGGLAHAAERAPELERLGYDGGITGETDNDPFLPLALAAEHTERLELITSIAVAFARNPMTLAQTAHDLQLLSGGRMVLGLGSQIKPHITKRFSMPWSHPAARMRELILALRAIWANWNEGEPLRFRGEFYTHTLMTPFFTPAPSPTGPPKVFLAAVGERMTEVAGEVADGLLIHAFTTERYVREVTLPALERGLAASGRARSAVQVMCPVFVVTGRDDAERAKLDRLTRSQVAFYGSTPAYRGVLAVHGWGDLQDELNRLSKQGRWDDMAALVDDDVVDAFAVVGAPDEIPGRLLARFGDLFDRVSFYAPLSQDEDALRAVISSLQAAGASPGPARDPGAARDGRSPR
jgi:probable F420-dependent oxidoreductase